MFPTFAAVLVLGWAQSAYTAETGNDHSATTTQSGVRHKVVVSITPAELPIPLSKMHNWVVHIETPDGQVFTPTQLSLVGGMPGHGHGLLSEPRVTRHLGNGEFLVEGVKFHMPGLWHLQVDVTGPDGPDTVRFEIQVDAGAPLATRDVGDWTSEQFSVLNSLSLYSSAKPSPDVSNRLSGNTDAGQLGAQLFFDKSLSSTDKVACATCHDPAKFFTDGRVKSVGSKPTARHAPTLLGLAHSSWFYWDGRRDSLWAQALTPIETPGEMDNTRVDAVRYVLTHPDYGPAFLRFCDSVSPEGITDLDRFPQGAGPFAGADGKDKWQKMDAADRKSVDRAFSDIGKVLAAYVETLTYGPSRFDQYVMKINEGNSRPSGLLSETELTGLRLFIDQERTPCLRCHNGPFFTNGEFHNTGTGTAPDGTQDWGRFLGLRAAMIDQFNCLGPYSDAAAEQCVDLNYAGEGHADNGAFKVPSLRNVAATAPYLHDGRFASIEDVVRAYTALPPQSVAMHDVPAFDLAGEEVAALVAFLGTLNQVEKDPYPRPHHSREDVTPAQPVTSGR